MKKETIEVLQNAREGFFIALEWGWRKKTGPQRAYMAT